MSEPEHQITVRYFAWVREKTGISTECIAVPDGVTTVGELVEFLRARGPEFEAAFAHPAAVRAAVDHAHVKPQASIAQAREVAFFPPVTGG